MKPYKTLSRWASTSNAENLVKVARIVYQLCDYTDFRAVFLKTKKNEGSGLFLQIRSHILYMYVPSSYSNGYVSGWG